MLHDRVNAACITGQLRTFLAPCVGAQMRDNLLLPLRLRTHVFLHDANASERRDVGVVLRDVDVARVEVRAERLGRSSPPCPVRGKEYVYTRALRQCFWSLHADRRPYDWVVRLRSDHTVPFQLHRLPRAERYYASYRWARGVAIVGSLSECACGWKRDACVDGRPARCDWVDDQFALLHGAAVRLYLHDLHARFCDVAALGLATTQQLATLDPERRLARLLRDNVTTHDVRFAGSLFHPRLQRTASDCTAAHDGRSPARTPPTLSVPALPEPLPPGPWDQRRFEVCERQRRLPPERRTLCRSSDGVWDDDWFGDDARKRMGATPLSRRRPPRAGRS